jgi:hypothetical protein
VIFRKIKNPHPYYSSTCGFLAARPFADGMTEHTAHALLAAKPAKYNYKQATFSTLIEAMLHSLYAYITAIMQRCQVF